ncbi:MAG: ATP-dependent DNA helicase RecG [Bacteroidales bacterium]
MDPLLQTDIKFLPGVGEKRAAILCNELGIKTFEDLVRHYPYKYTDRTRFYTIREIDTTQVFIQVRGQIASMELVGRKPKQRLVGHFEDATGSIELVWFQGIKWIQQSLKTGVEYIVFGKPALFNGVYSIPHPEIEEAAKAELTAYPFAFQAAYPTTEKMKSSFLTSRVIHKLQYQLLQKAYGRMQETLPGPLVQKLRFSGINDTLLNIHFPKDEDSLRKARYRLKFEELFLIQLGLLRQKNIKNKSVKGFIFPRIGDLFNRFYAEHLPFDLTGAQKRVMREIRKDLGSGRQMNRLLQGDVGSGKTLVALLSMLIALDNGHQACIMAPTEILAQQHYLTISRLLANLPVTVKLLTGSTRQGERAVLHEALREGELDILIGTHALIEDTVRFNNLGLAVIDEQHRFGVAQRARLWEKSGGTLPHVLVMTATPIPRTLAMTLYGDLDLSVIDEMPPGRRPIITAHYYDSKRLQVYEFIRKQIQSGRQVYIVYPLIQESENLDYKDLYDGYESICRAFPSPDYAVSVLHGRMKSEEKVKAMDYFVRGITKIMVSTTVIEVGVDVPNATVMVIESAERFGLSQLHQLRGRVGRGADQSYCLLMTGYKLSKEAKTRVETMVRTNDGFEIADVDMKLRGPGDLEGTQQSGMAFNLSIANLLTDNKILEYARRTAEEVLEEDPLLELPQNHILVELLSRPGKEARDWSRIS